MAKASDNAFPSLLLTEQASAPTTPAAGTARLYRGTDNKQYVIDDTGTSTELGAGGGGSTPTLSTYTPAITATGFALGTTGAVAFGRYVDDGLYVSGEMFFRAGSAGFAAGSGLYKFSIPVAAHADDVAYNLRAGAAHFYDGANTHHFSMSVLDANNLLGYVHANASHTAVNPVAPTASDEWRVQFRYRKA